MICIFTPILKLKFFSRVRYTFTIIKTLMAQKIEDVRYLEQFSLKYLQFSLGILKQHILIENQFLTIWLHSFLEKLLSI